MQKQTYSFPSSPLSRFVSHFPFSIPLLVQYHISVCYYSCQAFLNPHQCIALVFFPTSKSSSPIASACMHIKAETYLLVHSAQCIGVPVLHPCHDVYTRPNTSTMLVVQCYTRVTTCVLGPTQAQCWWSSATPVS